MEVALRDILESSECDYFDNQYKITKVYNAFNKAKEILLVNAPIEDDLDHWRHWNNIIQSAIVDLNYLLGRLNRNFINHAAINRSLFMFPFNYYVNLVIASISHFVECLRTRGTDVYANNNPFTPYFS